MTAHRTVEELEALLSGELAATELEQTETHLKECAQCHSDQTDHFETAQRWRSGALPPR